MGKQLITLNSYYEALGFVLKNRGHFENIKHQFGEVWIDNGYGSYFFKPADSPFNIFIVNLKEGQITSFSFYGESTITFQALIDCFGAFQRNYSPKDETWFFTVKDLEHNASITVLSDHEAPQPDDFATRFDIRFL